MSTSCIRRRGIRSHCIVVLLPVGVGLAPCVVAQGAPPAVVFERDVFGILKAHCFKCHGLEARKADLDLRSVALIRRGGEGGPVMVKGSAAKSRLYQRVAERSMPPKKELPLTEVQIETIRRWLDAGAPALCTEQPLTDAEAPAVTAEDRGFWAFRPPTRPPVPKVKSRERVRTPVDAFVLRRLEQKGLSFAPDADRRTLIRRAWLDLIGLPPSPDDVTRFLADSLPDAYERLVDGLLASPHFGERWGRHWLDVAGYVDVIGSDNDAAIIKIGENKWLYRDYVVGAFNDDKPYDEFLLEQIAGDELTDWRSADRFTPEMRRHLVATGYLRAAIDDTDQKELNFATTRYVVLHKTLEIVGTGVLGLTVGCARCHSHKYDPVPQRDYYRLMALFTPAYNPQAWIALSDRYLPDVAPAEKARIERHNAELDRQIEPSQKQIAELENTQRERLFAQKLATVPEPIRGDTKEAVRTPADKRDAVQKYLAGKFESLLKVKPEELAASFDGKDKAQYEALKRQVAELRGRRRGWGKLHALYDVGRPLPTYLLRRGNHETPGPEVKPGFLSVLCESEAAALVPEGASNADTSGRRLALARWLTRPGTPAVALTARVRVNRVWQQLFGVGIVSTPDNFGRSGEFPTHPGLLEWLGHEFMRNGWRVKPLLKQLMTSTVYRQASTRIAPPDRGETADPRAVDPGNELLWRMRLRRLDSEIVRDAMLTASGTLDRGLGGPPLPLENRPDGMVVLNEKKLSAWTSPGRRSLYVLARRNYHLSLLNVFDQPVVATNCARRTPSANVLQSLTLMNDGFVLDQAERFAARITSALPGAPAERRIERAFKVALSRPPTAEELVRSREFLERQAGRFRGLESASAPPGRKALATLCHALFNLNEFLYVH